MSTAVITFTYNETFNLPIWIEYYGKNFGADHLYVVDRSSTDGSVNGLGDVNIIRVPRNEFDEFEKTDAIASLHKSLLNFYDTVITTDCDEILVADPNHFASLSDYLDNSNFEYMNAIGLEVIHKLDLESPLDMNSPMLSQRRYARFQSPSCKNLVCRTPTRWLNGFHSCDKPPIFDGILYMFHTKVIDYNISMARQKINRDTKWSSRSTEQIPNSHHKYENEQFVHQNFLVPIDLVRRNEVYGSDLRLELEQFVDQTVERDGFYHIPMDMRKMILIPERFANVF